ncbi:MAG: hypothetical protein AAFY65_13860 [Pseudomonadota bacterium]
MYYVADTDLLLREGVLTSDQVAVVKRQARDVMVKLSVNCLLLGGIIAATLGLIFWLARPVPVAMAGGLALALGFVALAKTAETLRFFGNAASLIGAGLLLGGAGFELTAEYEAIAGPVMAVLGAIVACAFGPAARRPRLTSRFTCGAIFLMGVALHLAGIAFAVDFFGMAKWPVAFASLYAAIMIAFAGLLLDVRTVTALAIVPFAQVLSTGTEYWHAVYAFYSPESTLSILQMSALTVAGLWAAARLPARVGRHGGILAVMALIVANLCALVGSLWGDWVGRTIWGPRYYGSNVFGRREWEAYDTYRAAVEAFNATALHISEGVYAILWAVALACVAVWAAMKAKRGVFNTTMTFAGIHAYTQVFETLYDEPLAYVIGGLAAIPLAWGLWQINQRWTAGAA